LVGSEPANVADADRQCSSRRLLVDETAVRRCSIEVALATPEEAGVDRDWLRLNSRSMHKRVDKHGMLGPDGVRYSWVYWAAIAAAFALLIVDLFDDGAIWNIGVVVFIIIAIAVRPGGVRGPRAAAAGDEQAPRAT
jgi:hypothetical protein